MPKFAQDPALASAIQQHQAGQLAQAEEAYRQILRRSPGDADALHLLGVLCAQTGRSDQAVDFIKQAITVKPSTAEYHNNLGGILRSLGRADEAMAACRRAVELKADYAMAQYSLGTLLADAGQLQEAEAAFRAAPQLAEAHNHLGRLLRSQRRLDEAIAAFEKAIQLKPNLASAQNNLGNALRDAGRLDQANIAYERAILLQPDFAEAHHNLGNLLIARKKFDAAITSLERAIQIKPDFADAMGSLGDALREIGRFDEALDVYNRALRLTPDSAELHGNQGNLLRAMGRFEEAAAEHRRAIQLKPDVAEFHSNLGIALSERQQWPQAEAAFARAIELNGDLASAHWAMGLIQLLKGDLRAGWKNYQWWWTMQPPPFRQPRWEGEPIEGKTILIHAQEGLGDTLQFSRYAPLIAQRGGRVLLLCQPELKRLLTNLPGVQQVLSGDDALPEFDLYCPLLSLPWIFATDLASVPPPLTPQIDAGRVEYWKKKLPQDGRRRIGLVWAGNPRHSNDRQRSTQLANLRGLAGVPGVHWISLQKGPPAEQARQVPDLQLLDYTADLSDFADTAALIANLDLIVGVDTAVAHLAATMGKPVWLMLPFVPEWRWLLDRGDSPWYPTVRLYRQKSPGAWDHVVAAIAAGLTGR